MPAQSAAKARGGRQAAGGRAGGGGKAVTASDQWRQVTGGERRRAAAGGCRTGGSGFPKARPSTPMNWSLCPPSSLWSRLMLAFGSSTAPTGTPPRTPCVLVCWRPLSIPIETPDGMRGGCSRQWRHR